MTCDRQIAKVDKAGLRESGRAARRGGRVVLEIGGTGNKLPSTVRQ